MHKSPWYGGFSEGSEKVVPISFSEGSEKVLCLRFTEGSEMVVYLRFSEGSEKVVPISFSEGSEKLFIHSLIANVLQLFHLGDEVAVGLDSLVREASNLDIRMDLKITNPNLCSFIFSII